MEAVARFKEFKDRFDRADLQDPDVARELLERMLTEDHAFLARDETRADYLQLRGIIRFVRVNASQELFPGSSGERKPVQRLPTPRISFYVQELARAMSDLDESTKVRASIEGHDPEKIAKAKKAQAAVGQLMSSVSELDPDDP